jgi:hypothetical protein
MARWLGDGERLLLVATSDIQHRWIADQFNM